MKESTTMRIYYFTGTGNSLSVARSLIEKLQALPDEIETETGTTRIEYRDGGRKATLVGALRAVYGVSESLPAGSPCPRRTEGMVLRRELERFGFSHFTETLPVP